MPYLRIVVDDDPSQPGPGPMNLVDMGLSQAIVGRATHSMVSTFNCFNERDVRGIQQDSSRFSFVPFRQTTTHTHTICHTPSWGKYLPLFQWRRFGFRRRSRLRRGQNMTSARDAPVRGNQPHQDDRYMFMLYTSKLFKTINLP